MASNQELQHVLVQVNSGHFVNVVFGRFLQCEIIFFLVFNKYYEGIYLRLKKYPTFNHSFDH
jgi:hypothetical protein